MSKNKDLMTAWAAHRRANGQSMRPVQDPQPLEDEFDFSAEEGLEDLKTEPAPEEPTVPTRAETIANIVKKLSLKRED